MGLIVNAPQFSLYESNLPATPATPTGTNVAHGGVAHTKNSTFTELIASTSFDAQLVVIQVQNSFVANNDTSTLLDIAIGAASSESVVIPDIAAGWATATGRSILFPVRVPSGSRVSARTQSVRTTGGVDVLVQLFGGPRNPDAWWCGQHVEAVGENTSNSAGTKFTPGNTGAEGTGVSLGTLSQAAKCLVLGVQGHPDDTNWSALAYHFDVGIDSSSTEWLEADRFMALSNTTEGLNLGHTWWPIYRPLPSGTEIMVRGEASATADALSAIVYAIS